MRNSKIRGVSIHTTGEGLSYYIHYDELGTRNVDKSTYEKAMNDLQKWDILIDQNKKEASAIKL